MFEANDWWMIRECSGNTLEQWHYGAQKQPAGGCHSWEQAVRNPKCRLLVDWEAYTKSQWMLGISKTRKRMLYSQMFWTSCCNFMVTKILFFVVESGLPGEAIELYIPTIFAASEGWDGAVALALAGWVICWLVQWWGIDMKRWWCRKEFQTESAFLECAKGRDTLM